VNYGFGRLEEHLRPASVSQTNKSQPNKLICEGHSGLSFLEKMVREEKASFSSWPSKLDRKCKHL